MISVKVWEFRILKEERVLIRHGDVISINNSFVVDFIEQGSQAVASKSVEEPQRKRPRNDDLWPENNEMVPWLPDGNK